MRKALLVVALFCFALLFVGQTMAQEGAGGAEWSKTAFDKSARHSQRDEVRRYGGKPRPDVPLCCRENRKG